MWKVLTPRKIVFGENGAEHFEYPDKSLIITTTTPDIYNKWIEDMGIKNYEVYENTDLSIEVIEKVPKEFEGRDISAYIGLGGGSSMDVCNILEN